MTISKQTTHELNVNINTLMQKDQFKQGTREAKQNAIADC